MAETKVYPTDVALSAASGKMLCASFDAVHEIVTDLAGWPVMTHHMASDELMDAVQAKVVRQVSWMPGAIENMPDFAYETRAEAEAAVRAYTARIAAAHGETVELDLGEPLPPLGLFAGLDR
ncbi:MAG: hypothetical protein JWM36_4886 [Hyphomicrobiales bacterium]|nr:hypothetical protein [Hyphomicrobiales bacterium]